MRERPLRCAHVRGNSRVAMIGGIVVLALLVGSVFVAAKRAETSGRATAPGSSFRADESGHRAARLLLESLDFTVHSRRGARLPDGIGHVLVREEGLPGSATEGVPERERVTVGAEFDAWIERGNSALIFASRTPPGTGWPDVRDRYEIPEDDSLLGPEVVVIGNDASLLDVFGSRPEVPEGGVGIQEEHEFEGLGDPWITPYYVIEPADGDEVLAVRVTDAGDREPVIVRSSRGRGTVIVVADPWFATNVRLLRGDNAAWLATMVDELIRDGDVWFDDRALGHAASRGVLSLFEEAGLGPAMVATLLLLLLVWWRVGPSDAPDRVTRPQHGYDPAAYADLRAGLYAECLTADEVRRMVRAEVGRRLSQGDGVSYERALALLQTRDPKRAERIQGALEGLPQHAAVTVAKHARTWCIAVSQVWAALDESSPVRSSRDGPLSTGSARTRAIRRENTMTEIHDDDQ